MSHDFLSQLRFWKHQHLPVILQTEAAECGLASVCMVSSYWGHRIDLASMRRRFSVSLKGSTLKSLISMAQGIGLQTRPLKLDMEHLPELKLPCILHWDMNHFVVLKSVTAQHAVIHDPAVGERKLKLDEFSRHFTGVALELTPGAEFKKTEEIQQFSLLALMGRVIGLKSGLLKLLLLGLALQVCALVLPFYMQWTVDEALVAADRDLVTVLGCGFLLLVLLQTCISATRSWMTTVLSTSLNFQWLSNAFSHLMRLPLPYFEKRHTGDIVSRFGSIQTMQHSMTTQFVEGLIDGVLVIGTFLMMLWYSPLLAGISCIAVVLYALLRWMIFQPLRNASAEQIIHTAKQQTHFMESVRGIQSVRLFSRAEERRAGWMNALADQFNADLRIARIAVSYQTANSLIFSAERILIIWMAALAVLDQKFSIGMVFAFISYKDQFSQRVASLIDKLFELRMLRLHGERVADILLTQPESEQHLNEYDPAQLKADIEFHNVSFRYADGEPYILRNLNLHIREGQFVAITGPSGCGKTTLMKLMLGLLEPSEGEILISGIRLQQLGLANFRRLLGTVMQDDQLFAGSIADNIAFFDPAPDMQRIQMCALMASVHQEIIQMPMAYNTLIGDIGSGISGGQKQRILLARALYNQPRLLVMDEATSHLDVQNEHAVNQAIRQIPLTRIMVAHRPDTIAMAERLIVLANGQVQLDQIQHPPSAQTEARTAAAPSAHVRGEPVTETVSQ